MKNFFKQIKDAAMKGFWLGYGKPKEPEVETFEMNEAHINLAHSIFNLSCMNLTEAGQHAPMFFLVGKDRFFPVLIQPTRPDNNIDVSSYASAVINLADEKDADAIMFVSEQWQVGEKLSDQEVEGFKQGKLLPSLHPDREEVLTLVYVTSKGDMKLLMGEIQRTPDNTPFVRESVWTNADNVLIPFLQPWR